MHLIQLLHNSGGRRIAMVMGEELILIKKYLTAFDLAKSAMEQKSSITALVEGNISQERISYHPVYQGLSAWKILPAFDHPTDPRCCMITGTGLTHTASAKNRQAMHAAAEQSKLTDSMIMYQWGMEGGKPEAGNIGIQPEWFYKGNGSQLKAHGDPLCVPNYGLDGGEEPEIAGIYINDGDGTPHRVGFATANEFSDHVMEKKNYLYLAPSKIRHCSIGPELVITDAFKSIAGKASISRRDQILWEQTLHTGEDHMSHSLENLEYHHFKYDNHRLPWDIHIHFMGTSAFSFGAGISLQDGDLMSILWEGMGRALVNPLSVDKSDKKMMPLPRL
ncbi:MAG: AraD1 family protein [Saprospiraceae bacterium]|nr:AraD1 family protein [Saprospiraceae bacterium]